MKLYAHIISYNYLYLYNQFLHNLYHPQHENLKNFHVCITCRVIVVKLKYILHIINFIYNIYMVFGDFYFFIQSCGYHFMWCLLILSCNYYILVFLLRLLSFLELHILVCVQNLDTLEAFLCLPSVPHKSKWMLLYSSSLLTVEIYDLLH